MKVMRGDRCSKTFSCLKISFWIWSWSNLLGPTPSSTALSRHQHPNLSKLASLGCEWSFLSLEFDIDPIVETAGERILIWLEELVKIPGALDSFRVEPLPWRQVIAGQVGARLAKWVPDLRADALQSIVGPDSMWEEAPLSGRRGERY